jgi:hypothetical protein
MRAFNRLLREHPHLTAVPRPVVRRYAELSILVNEFRSRISEQGILDENGEPRSIVEAYRRLAMSELKFAQLVFNLGDIENGRDTRPILDLDQIQEAEPAGITTENT